MRNDNFLAFDDLMSNVGWYLSRHAPFHVDLVLKDKRSILIVVRYGDKRTHAVLHVTTEEYLEKHRKIAIPEPGDRCFSGPRSFIVHAVKGNLIELIDKADGCLYRCHLSDYFWNCTGNGYGKEVFSRFAKYEKIENFFTTWDRLDD